MIKECLPVLGESRNPWPQAGHNNCSKSPFALSVRGGAVAARWAHNPKVVGSNPTPATIFSKAYPTLYIKGKCKCIT